MAENTARGSEHPAEPALPCPLCAQGLAGQVGPARGSSEATELHPLLDTPQPPQHIGLHLLSAAGNLDTPSFFSFLFVIIK